MTVATRFAPSPTGDLHLGHAFAAAWAHDRARRAGGRFMVRIEDIDQGRCRETFIRRNLEDLAWLGLRWERPVVRQSERMDLYRSALDRLEALDVTYPCFCTRKQIQAQVSASAAAPHHLPSHSDSVYPGTCRTLPLSQRMALLAAGRSYAVRLDSVRAEHLTGPLTWTDRDRGPQTVTLESFGDVVIARKEISTSYHLAVVVDDAAQGITEVTRGEDLFAATHVHRLLQALLDLPVPLWHHHPLCRDEGGQRLAKRRGSHTIRALRERGYSPSEVLAEGFRRAGALDAGPGSAATRSGP